MCQVCDFYQKIQPAQKADTAIAADGSRTIWGYYDADDAAVLARYYPNVGEVLIAEIAALIHHPRLLEVAGAIEVVERYLEGAFSRIKDAGVQVAANPLSILFWSEKHDRIMRVKTDETEMLHGPMEKLALRHGSMQSINQLLDTRHGVQLTFGCSCCAIAVATGNLPALHASKYYQMREGLGRHFDSDVLTVTGDLFTGISVSDVPAAILAATADFHQEEVVSYQRFAAATRAALQENHSLADSSQHVDEARCFLLGLSHEELHAAE